MENVIYDIERCICHVPDACKDCSHYGHGEVIGCMEELLTDVLALLKEQEAVERTYRTGINGFSLIWTCGACGSDLHPNNAKAKYCSNCGQEVKWE